VRAGIKIIFENKTVSLMNGIEVCALGKMENNLPLFQYDLKQSQTFVVSDNKIQDWHEQ
jgi:hypothetical protein